MWKAESGQINIGNRVRVIQRLEFLLIAINGVNQAIVDGFSGDDVRLIRRGRAKLLTLQGIRSQKNPRLRPCNHASRALYATAHKSSDVAEKGYLYKLRTLGKQSEGRIEDE